MDKMYKIILAAVIFVASDGLIVHGPSGPLVTSTGSTVVLPCYVDKPLSTQNLLVVWTRTELNATLIRYQYGKTRLWGQDEFYKGRVDFFTEEIQRGNFSLRLDNVRAEDQGNITCNVQSQQDFGKTVFYVKVERLLASGSNEKINASVEEDVTFNCSLKSTIPPEGIEAVRWFKLINSNYILILLYQNNTVSLNPLYEQYRDRVELFKEEIPKGNLALKLNSARVEDKGVYICQVDVGGKSDQSSVFLSYVSDAEYCKNINYAKAKRKDLFLSLGMDKNDSDIEIYRKWPLVFMDQPVKIYIDLYVASILTVNEKAQSITTQVIMITAWSNYNMQWNRWEYCGMDTFVAPKDYFWIPDISIKESIKTEYGRNESPYVKLFSFGVTASTDVLSLITACKMDLYRFPFDTQKCNITFQSTVYSAEEMRINLLTDANYIKLESRKFFESQGEWELFDINTSKDQIHRWFTMDQLTYQITIKRRPLLYVINIILPVFFFLLLDVSSFFIDASGQDKLNFKVTLLLSISVFLLILKDTLPSTADKLPLIGIYCCGIFFLMGISLLETIFVNFLRDKIAKRRSAKASISGQFVNLQSFPEMVNGQTEMATNEYQAAAQPKKTCVCWSRVATIVDVTFMILYVITSIVFLSILASLCFPRDYLNAGNSTQK